MTFIFWYEKKRSIAQALKACTYLEFKYFSYHDGKRMIMCVLKNA